MEEIIKELEQIGKELFSKYGVDSYNTRCKLHDAREKLKALTIHSVVDSKRALKAWDNGYTQGYDDGSVGKPKHKKLNVY